MEGKEKGKGWETGRVGKVGRGGGGGVERRGEIGQRRGKGGEGEREEITALSFLRLSLSPNRTDRLVAQASGPRLPRCLARTALSE